MSKAKAIKYFVTHDGHTFTRNSPRVYTHVVIVARNIEEQRAEAIKWARSTYKMNLEYHEMMANAPEYVGTFANGTKFTRPIKDEERAAAKVTLEGGMGAAVADRLREFDKHMADTKATWKSADGKDTLYCAGWCGRLDLAVKLAAKQPRSTIVAVSIK